MRAVFVDRYTANAGGGWGLDRPRNQWRRSVRCDTEHQYRGFLCRRLVRHGGELRQLITCRCDRQRCMGREWFTAGWKGDLWLRQPKSSTLDRLGGKLCRPSSERGVIFV